MKSMISSLASASNINIYIYIYTHFGKRFFLSFLKVRIFLKEIRQLLKHIHDLPNHTKVQVTCSKFLMSK